MIVTITDKFDNFQDCLAKDFCHENSMSAILN